MRTINCFEGLVALLRNWRSWQGDNQYDFGGMASLLGACLDNLREAALEAEIDDIGSFLEPEQRAFLAKIASHSTMTEGSDRSGTMS